MDNFYLITGLLIALGLNSILLLARKKKWCTNKLRFGITGFLFTIGLIGLILIEDPPKFQRLFLIWIQLPIIHSLIDRFFRFLSIKIHNRDFLLYIRGSEDLDYKFKNPNLKSSDYIFSIILIILLFVLPLIAL